MNQWRMYYAWGAIFRTGVVVAADMRTYFRAGAHVEAPGATSSSVNRRVIHTIFRDFAFSVTKYIEAPLGAGPSNLSRKFYLRMR